MESVNTIAQQPTALYNIALFNLLGDPTMRVNTIIPRKISTPIIDKKVDGGYLNISVSAESSVERITIFNNTELWNYTVLGNIAEFRVPYSSDLGLSLTGENLIPYFTDIIVLKDLQLQDEIYTGELVYKGEKVTIGHLEDAIGSKSVGMLDANIEIECEEIVILPSLTIDNSSVNISIK